MDRPSAGRGAARRRAGRFLPRPPGRKTASCGSPIPSRPGLTDFDEFGNYSGYTYEYLEEIAQYTGWDYEFVQAPGSMDDSLTTLMGMLQEGEIDLMGAMLYTEQMGRRSTTPATITALLKRCCRCPTTTCRRSSSTPRCSRPSGWRWRRRQRAAGCSGSLRTTAR